MVLRRNTTAAERKCSEDKMQMIIFTPCFCPLLGVSLTATSTTWEKSSAIVLLFRYITALHLHESLSPVFILRRSFYSNSNCHTHAVSACLSHSHIHTWTGAYF